MGTVASYAVADGYLRNVVDNAHLDLHRHFTYVVGLEACKMMAQEIRSRQVL